MFLSTTLEELVDVSSALQASCRLAHCSRTAAQSHCTCLNFPRLHASVLLALLLLASFRAASGPIDHQQCTLATLTAHALSASRFSLVFLSPLGVFSLSSPSVVTPETSCAKDQSGSRSRRALLAMGSGFRTSTPCARVQRSLAIRSISSISSMSQAFALAT